MKTLKQYSIKIARQITADTITGTLSELINHFSHTLEVGQRWQHEKGNAKIDLNPKSIKSLITNLENASNNAASNGCSGVKYSHVVTVSI